SWRVNDRLPAPAWNSAPHPVAAGRRAAAASLERGEAVLAEQGRQAEMVQVDVVVERQRRKVRSIVLGQRHDFVIEAGHGDSTFGRLEPRDDRGERVGGVLD